MKISLSSADVQAYNAQRGRRDRKRLCHAPSNGMYFGFRGTMTSCCANRTQVLGVYPEQSIREAWFGKKAKALRKAIKNNDFSKGCMACHSMIEAKNYTNLPAKNFDQIGRNWRRYPTKMDFELSNICNLECVMCRGELSSSIRKNRDQLPAIPSPYDDAFVEQLIPFLPYLKSSQFLGGEPFLIQEYINIWELMAELNPRVAISVQTNATVMTPRVRKVLQQLKCSIAVSLDSLEKDTYAAIRVNGDLDRALDNIHYFKKYCDDVQTELTISFCPMTMNWHELPNFVYFCNRLGIKAFFNTVLFPKQYSLTSLQHQELVTILQELPSADRLPKNSPVAQYNRIAYAGVLEQINQWASASAQRAQTKKVLTEEVLFSRREYFLALKEYCETSTDISVDRQQLYEEVREKMDFIITESTRHNTEQNIMKQLHTIDFKTITQYVPGSEPNDLYQRFKAVFLVAE
jgi:MoaA/NifB/PqqE/SkfB family radical SAM enzyme